MKPTIVVIALCILGFVIFSSISDTPSITEGVSSVLKEDKADTKPRESNKLISESVPSKEKTEQAKFKKIYIDDLDEKTKARILKNQIKNVSDQEVFEKYLTPEELAYTPEPAEPREVTNFTFKNGKVTQEKVISTQPRFYSEFGRKMSLRFLNHKIEKLDSGMENTVDLKKLQELQEKKESYIHEIRRQYNKKRFNEITNPRK